MRVLVVEDDLVSRRALLKLLRSEGHDPIGVASGREALQAWGEVAPELVILDYRLPDMTGLDVLAEIRVAARARPPALLVTGHGLSAATRAAAEADGLRIFPKPVSPTELLRAVRSAGERPFPSPSAP